MAKIITIEDLLSAYSKFNNPTDTDGVLTTNEIADAIGWGVAKVRRYLKIGIKNNTIIHCYKTTIGIDGANCRSDAYRIVKEKTK